MGEQFEEERLVELLVQNRALSADDLQGKVIEAIAAFAGGNLQDDVTVLALSVR